jgi:transposase
MGSPRECTRIPGLEGYRVDRIEWEADGPRARVRIWIERRGVRVRGYQCAGCARRTWRIRDAKERTWDDLPWAEHRVTLVCVQRRVRCWACGIRTERVGFARVLTTRTVCAVCIAPGAG